MSSGSKSPLKSNRGGALVITLGLMLLLTIVAIMAVKTSHSELELSFNQVHANQAFYVAEAGLKRALVTLIHDNTWETGYANEWFELGVFSVAVIHTDVDSLIIDTITLRSTGVVEGAVANLEALVVPKLWRPFQFAMFGDDSLGMTNNCCTDSFQSDSGTYAATVLLEDGDVASNGNVDLTNSAWVGGDASSALESGVSVCATCSVSGDVQDEVAPYILDPIPDSAFVAAHDYNLAPSGFSGSYTYDATTHDLSLGIMESVQLSGGIYFFNDVDLSTNSQVTIAPGEKVIIYMTGDLILANNTSVNASGVASDLLIMSRGSIFTLGMSINITASFYGPDADVFIGNGCNFYGSVVGNSIIMDNAACVHYDRALSDYAVGVTGEMVMLAWKED